MVLGRGWHIIAGLACLAMAAASAPEGTLPEESEVAAEATSLAIAGTVMGSMCFLMSLFYLTNHPDPDMRRYTYQVISTTISIFCAVLLFQACNDLVEAHILEGTSHEFQLMVDILHMLFWFVVLQMAVAIVVKQAVSAMFDADGTLNEDFDLESLETKTASVAMLLAHMTGFAAINAWGTLQQSPLFRSSWVLSVLTVPIAIVATSILQGISNRVRKQIRARLDSQSSQEQEERKKEYKKIWDEETEEAVEDVKSLTASFLFSQSMRFMVCGTLPDTEGNESWEAVTDHSNAELGWLIGMAVVFVVLTVVLDVINHKPEGEASEDVINHKPEGEASEAFTDGSMEAESSSWLSENNIRTFIDACCKTFAWCLFFGMRWWVGSFMNHQESSNRMLLAVAVTMVTSLGSFAVIWCLDKLADADWTDDTADHAIIKVISGLGILVGFGWEQCFDEALASLSEQTPNPHFTKMAFAVFCAAVIVPAWRYWILPMELKEGWRWGFICDKEDKEKWVDLLQHENWKSLVDSSEEVRECLRAIVQEADAPPELDRAAVSLLRKASEQEEVRSMGIRNKWFNAVTQIKEQSRRKSAEAVPTLPRFQMNDSDPSPMSRRSSVASVCLTHRSSMSSPNVLHHRRRAEAPDHMRLFRKHHHHFLHLLNRRHGINRDHGSPMQRAVSDGQRYDIKCKVRDCYVRLDNDDRCVSGNSQERQDRENKQGMEMERLKEENRRLRGSLTEVLEKFESHMGTMTAKMDRLESLPASPRVYSARSSGPATPPPRASKVSEQLTPLSEQRDTRLAAEGYQPPRLPTLPPPETT